MKIIKKILIVFVTFIIVYYSVLLTSRMVCINTLSKFLHHDNTNCTQEIILRGYLKEEGFNNTLILVDTIYSSKDESRIINSKCRSFTELRFFYPSSIVAPLQWDDFDDSDSKDLLFSLSYKDSIQTRKIAGLYFPEKSSYINPEITVQSENYLKSDNLLVKFQSKNDFEGYNLNTLKDAYFYCIENEEKNQKKYEKFIYLFQNQASKKRLIISYFDFGKSFIIRIK